MFKDTQTAAAHDAILADSPAMSSHEITDQVDRGIRSTRQTGMARYKAEMRNPQETTMEEKAIKAALYKNMPSVAARTMMDVLHSYKDQAARHAMVRMLTGLNGEGAQGFANALAREAEDNAYRTPQVRALITQMLAHQAGKN
jgi:dGTP triphosphohydrolase